MVIFLRRLVFRAVNEAFKDKAKLVLEDVKLEHPKIENYGDYATNIAMKLSKQLKMKPQDTAKNIAEKINEYIIKDKTIIFSPDSKDSKNKKIVISEILESVDAKTIGVGFINFKLKQNFLINLAFRLLRNENIIVTTKKEKRKIMVEFAHPNTHKEFHIGHLRNIDTRVACTDTWGLRHLLGIETVEKM